MQTCTNPECLKETYALYEGDVCKECFVPPVVVDLPVEGRTHSNLEERTCNYVECKKQFKQEHPSQGYCDKECKRLQKIIYARQYRKDNK